jgi:hypothetical protein
MTKQINVKPLLTLQQPFVDLRLFRSNNPKFFLHSFRGFGHNGGESIELRPLLGSIAVGDAIEEPGVCGRGSVKQKMNINNTDVTAMKVTEQREQNLNMPTIYMLVHPLTFM